MTPVAIALGSNLGDRRSHIDWAWAELRRDLASARMSDVIETLPHDVPDAQPSYLNAVVVGETSRPPGDVVTWLLDLEQQRGRIRRGPRSARTLDLDLVLYGSVIVDGPHLQIPHPRFREREFVLGPLASLAPAWIDPATGRSVGELMAALESRLGR